MPVSTMLVVAAIVSVFSMFAAVLVWGDLQTRPGRLAATTVNSRDHQKRRSF